MKCLYCGGILPQSSDLSEPEFCSDDHRLHYQSATRLRRCNHSLPLTPPSVATCEEHLRTSEPLHSLVPTWPLEAAPANDGRPHLEPLLTVTGCALPTLNIRPPGPSVVTVRWNAAWRSLGTNWRRVPKTVQVSIIAVPLLLTAVSHGWPSTAALGWAGTGVQSFIKNELTEFGSQVEQRAGIQLSEDFRDGLHRWRNRSHLKPAWSFDNAGFIHPAALALFGPTVGLVDYQLDFNAQIDRQGFGLVFRARDFNNYYAVKLVVTDPGPLPRLNIVRYADIKGREGPHTTRPVPLNIRADTWYTVRLDVRKTDFTLSIQDQVADYWTDDRLAEGGVGFFCGKGEQARLRMIAVSHQNDTLGKLCAYLKPHGKSAQ